MMTSRTFLIGSAVALILVAAPARGPTTARRATRRSSSRGPSEPRDHGEEDERGAGREHQPGHERLDER